MQQLMMPILVIIKEAWAAPTPSRREGSGKWQVSGSDSVPLCKFPGSTPIFALLFAFFWLALSTSQAHAQAIDWVSTGGGIGTDSGMSIATDNANKIYATGNFTGTATFGPYTLSGEADTEIFLAKYDAQGNILWITSAGGVGESNPRQIAVDNSGNSYIGGIFSGSLDFGSVSITTAHPNELLNFNAFIAKYDTNGNFLWAKHIPTSGDLAVVSAIAVGNDGFLYTTGMFRGTADFGGVTLSSNGTLDFYIAKYDTAGNLIWARDSNNGALEEGTAIAVHQGEIYVAGRFRGTATFGSFVLTSVGPVSNDDIFIAKYASNGAIQWAKRAGGVGDDSPSDITADSNGDLYLTGSFFATADFDTAVLSSAGSYDIFIAKYSSSGTPLWVQRAGGIGWDTGSAMEFDHEGNLYIAGDIQEDASFESIKQVTSRALFLARLDDHGHFVWIRHATSSPLDIFTADLAIDNNNFLYLTGGFRISANFEHITVYDTGDETDIFVARWRPGATTDPIFDDGFESGNFAQWSNWNGDSGDLSVSTAAALVGNRGMQAVVDDNNSIGVRDEVPANERRYRARFYFDPNNINMVEGDTHVIFFGYSGNDLTRPVLRVEFRYVNGNYQLRPAFLNDGTTWRMGGRFNISNEPHVIELDWHAATTAGANNGSLGFWIDDVLRSVLTDVDNDTRRIDTVRLGAIAGIDNGTRGTYYFDAIESRRLTYIGADPNVAVAMAAPATVTALDEIMAWTDANESDPEEAALMQEVLEYAEQVKQEKAEETPPTEEDQIPQLFLPYLNRQ